MGPFCYIKCYRFPFTFQAVELFTHEQATQNPIIGRTVVGGVQMLSFNTTKIGSKWPLGTYLEEGVKVRHLIMVTYIS